MIIAGINAGRSAPPSVDPDRQRDLGDGSSAVIKNSAITCALAEERASRQRYAGGFKTSLPRCLDHAASRLEDVDVFGLSTCCDRAMENAQDRADTLLDELVGEQDADNFGARDRRDIARKTVCIDHHDSHATLGFVSSGFERAIVIIADGFGNRRSGPETFITSDDWWRHAFDRQTVYIGTWADGYMRLEPQDGPRPADPSIGLAELYRCLTHYLGWGSYQYAGKSMALASFGDPDRFCGLSLVSPSVTGTPLIDLPNRHSDPIGMLNRALRDAGYSVPDDLIRPGDPSQPFLCDLAARVQNVVETSLIDWVETLSDFHGISNIVLSGGLALNSVANGKLAAHRPDLRVFVPPAPGDTGQGLGNALWLLHSEASPVRQVRKTASSHTPLLTAALGPSIGNTELLEGLGLLMSCERRITLTEFPDQGARARAVAGALSKGKIVAVREGNAELGPRALGQSSILIDARVRGAKDRVNRIKGREPFRPFGASILADHTPALIQGAVPSPFMSFVGTASDGFSKTAPDIVHVDGTTRYQTVTRETGLLALILEEFTRSEGFPALLNTSFNIHGEPMVLGAEDAVKTFLGSEIDVLCLEGHIIEKSNP